MKNYTLKKELTVEEIEKIDVALFTEYTLDQNGNPDPKGSYLGSRKREKEVLLQVVEKYKDQPLTIDIIKGMKGTEYRQILNEAQKVYKDSKGEKNE